MKNSRLRPGTKVFGKPLCAKAIAVSPVSAVSLISPEHAEIDDVVVAELAAPVGEFAPQALDHCGAALELDPVALAVIEPDRLDRGKARQRPGEAGRRILPAGEQHERPFRACVDQVWLGHPTRDSVSGGPYQHAAQRRVIVASK